jgi:hypothetical protein
MRKGYRSRIAFHVIRANRIGEFAGKLLGVTAHKSGISLNGLKKGLPQFGMLGDPVV